MSEFIRLPSRIVNLSALAFIDFDATHAILHTTGGARLIVHGDDAAELLRQLEDRYGLMTAPAARLMEEPDPKWLR